MFKILRFSFTCSCSYNATAFFSGTSPVTEPSGVLKSKSSVCEGYARLFQALCVYVQRKYTKLVTMHIKCCNSIMLISDFKHIVFNQVIVYNLSHHVNFINVLWLCSHSKLYMFASISYHADHHNAYNKNNKG